MGLRAMARRWRKRSIALAALFLQFGLASAARKESETDRNTVSIAVSA
jgi:hypothetical protein